MRARSGSLEPGMSGEIFLRGFAWEVRSWVLEIVSDRLGWRWYILGDVDDDWEPQNTNSPESHLLPLLSDLCTLSCLIALLLLKFKTVQDIESLEMASSSIENQQCRANGLFAPTQKEPKLPWVETPLRESYTLSQAVGWYGLPSFTPCIPSLSHLFPASLIIHHIPLCIPHPIHQKRDF